MNLKFAGNRCRYNGQYPFVCLFIPFVEIRIPKAIPFICVFRPLIDNSRKNSGFSLIELMITLTVVGVLVGLAAPAFTAFIANQRISGNANELLTDLVFARSEAVKRTTPVTVCKTSNPNIAGPVCNATDADRWTAGRLVFLDSNGDGDIDVGDQILRIRQELEGAGPGRNSITGVGNITGTANRITFVSNGASHLTAEGQLFVCDSRGNAQALAIAIQTTGRARVTAKGKDKDGNNIGSCP